MEVLEFFYSEFIVFNTDKFYIVLTDFSSLTISSIMLKNGQACF